VLSPDLAPSEVHAVSSAAARRMTGVRIPEV
jgi:hypothetical protein